MSISHVPAQPDHVIVPRVALSVDQTAAALGTSRTFVENIIRGRDCRGLGRLSLWCKLSA